MRLPTHRPPIHPGEILLEEYLKPLGITQRDFAKHLGWTATKLNELIREKRGVTPAIALDLSEALGTHPSIWMNMQAAYDLWYALRDKSRPQKRAVPQLKKAS